MLSLYLVMSVKYFSPNNGSDKERELMKDNYECNALRRKAFRRKAFRRKTRGTL